MTWREKRVGRRAAIFAALAVASFMTACPGAQAKTVLLGSPLTASFQPLNLNADGCCPTLIQMPSGDPAAPPLANSSPVDGTVISYRLSEAHGTFAIQLVQVFPFPGSFFNPLKAQSVASSTPTPVASSGVSSPIATNLAITKGEYVGIRNFVSQPPDTIGTFSGNDSVITGEWRPALTDGAPFRLPNNLWRPTEIAMQATVRYCKVPKLKGKSSKAARKALTAADCTIGKVKKTKKVRDKKEVLSQSVKPGTSVSDTKPIKLGLSRKQG